MILLIDPSTPTGGPYTLMTYGARSGMFADVVPPAGSGLVEWYDDPTPNAMGVR